MTPPIERTNLDEARLAAKMAAKAGYQSLAKIIEDMADELSLLRQQTEWRDIADAPRDGTRVLIYIPALDLQAASTFEHGAWQNVPWTSNIHDLSPTRWQHLPSPPVQEEDK